MGFSEFGTDYQPPTPRPLKDTCLQALFDDAEARAHDGELSPNDYVSRLHLSSIFSAEEVGPAIAAVGSLQHYVDLPETIYANCRILKRSVQCGGISSSLPLCVLRHKSTTLDELALNTILSSVYLAHDKRRFKTKSSELSHIANSLSSFLESLFSAHNPVQLEWDSIS